MAIPIGEIVYRPMLAWSCGCIQEFRVGRHAFRGRPWSAGRSPADARHQGSRRPVGSCASLTPPAFKQPAAKRADVLKCHAAAQRAFEQAQKALTLHRRLTKAGPSRIDLLRPVAERSPVGRDSGGRLQIGAVRMDPTPDRWPAQPPSRP